MAKFESKDYDADKGFLEEAGDFLQYGIGSAVVSGGVSVVNTAISLGNVFGADVDEVDTADVLDDIGATDASNYYEDHRDAIDAVGFVATSFVPGMAGIKALRAVQRGAKLTSSSKLITGFKAAAVPNTSIKPVIRAIRAGRMEDALGTEKYKLIAKGFQQQALEAAAFEGAVLLTMNQNSTINAEKYGYFESMAENAAGAGFGVLLGGAIGGTVEGLVNSGKIAKIVSKRELRASKYRKGGSEGIIGSIAGDKALSAFRSFRRVRDTLESDVSFNGKDLGKIRTLREAKTIQEESLRASLLEFSNGNEVISNAVFKQLATRSDDEARDFLAGMNKARAYYDKDSLFDVPASQVANVLEDEFNANMLHYYNTNPTAWNKANGRLTLENVAKVHKNTRGVAFGTGDDMGKTPFMGTGMSKVTKDTDFENIFTWRHETGHLNANQLAGAFKNSALGRRLETQARELSKIARPDNWSGVLDEAAIKKLALVDPKAAEEASYWAAYMNNPKELLADAYAMLSNPNTSEAMRKQAPDLYKMFVGNKSMADTYGPTKSIMDVSTGTLTQEGIVPTIADLGAKVELEKAGRKTVAIKYGNGKRISLNDKYDMATIATVGQKDGTTIEKSAGLFAAAKERTDIVKDMTIEWDDLPRLTAAYVQKIQVQVVKNGEAIPYGTDLRKHILSTKAIMFKELKKVQLKLPKEQRMSMSEHARLLDTSESFLERVSDDIGTQAAIDRGQLRVDDIPMWSAREGVNPLEPSYVVLEADKRAMLEGDRMKSLADVESRIEANRRIAEGPIAAYMGESYEALPKSAYRTGENFADHISSADRTSGLLGAVRSATDNGMSVPQLIGKIANKVSRKYHEMVDTKFESSINKISNDSAALAEVAALDSILRKDWYKFAPNSIDELAEQLGNVVPENLEVLAASKVLDDVVKEGETIWTRDMAKLTQDILTKQFKNPDALDARIAQLETMATKGSHEIKSPEVAKLWRDMVEYNGNNIVQHKKSLAGIRGGSSSLDGELLYPGPVNTNRFPHFALVTSKTKGIMDDGEVSMIFAHDAKALAAKISRVETSFGDKVKVLRKGEIEAYKKRNGDFDSKLLMRENSMDSALQRNGISWDLAPEPDVNIMLDYMSNFKKQHTGLTRGFIEVKYSEEIAGLRHYGQNFELNEKSTTGFLKSKKRNVFHDVESLMLDKSNKDRSEFWDSINTVSDKAFSSAYYAIKGTLNNAAHTGNWQEMNAALENYGMKGVYSEMNKLVLQNVQAPKPMLEGMTARLNGVLATSMLRLDTAQAIVNTISTPIMLVPEFKAMVKLAKADRVKVLKDGTRVTVAGSKYDVGNAGALMSQAVKDFFTKPDLRAKYQRLGILDSTLDEVKRGIDLAAINPNHTPSEIMARLNKAVDIASTPTDKSEQLVKFVAARVADLVGETLHTAPHLREAAINAFVTRVHGNYLASQRPTLFQGWAGQAIGLFQTYQFNLLQGAMKHISSGNGKALASMAGLQGGIFGAQSLPGFQYLNQHIGERSKDDTDFYSTVNNIAGDDFGNFLLYGAASSATVPILGNGIDLYSRGDLTPRTPILLPTSAAEIPIVSFTNKLVSNITQASEKITNGAPVGQTMQEALAHNGFNRPLAGLMQVLGTEERTTNKGTLLRTYQSWDAWNIATKALGAKPLDEAVAVSSFYRTAAYKAYRNEKLESLGQAFKSTIAAGGFDADVYREFGTRYAEKGGDIEKFSSWVTRQMSRATNSQINELRKTNSSPEGRYLQEVLGAPVEDYYHPPESQ